MSLCAESLVLLSLCSLLVIVEPQGAVIVVSVMVTAAWGFHHLTRERLGRWGQARQHHEGLRMQEVQQGLGGVKDVLLLGREVDFLDRFGLHNTQSAHVAQLQSTLQKLPKLWLELLAVFGLALLVISMVAQGRTFEAVLPTLGVFAAAGFRIMPSVNRMLGAVQSVRYAFPVIDSLHTEFELASPRVASARTPPTAFRETLELKEISYTYLNAAKPALERTSFTIHRGEVVGIVGMSGAGKSTLADIILGLLSPDEGEVRVDGQDIHQALRNWQDQIGYVPQSIFFADDTLRRNVAFGLADAQIDEAAVRRAIRDAQMEDFVHSLPAGLDTMLGERGVRLSGGQRQRIGIARALYHDPAVLMLDEATSALDTGTERGVMEAVLALRGSKTILIVAHRLSTVELCDRLFRLEQGQIVEEVGHEAATRSPRIQAS
jgi:ABC-type multidrug transport system fused ATPase/permease subunit